MVVSTEMENTIAGAGRIHPPKGKPGAVLVCCVLCVAGCREPEPSGSLLPGSMLSPAPQTANRYPDRAYLTVTEIEVSAPFVRRNQAFAVRLRVRNEGGRAVESFEVQAQANLDRTTSVLSYEIGGREKLGLQPGQTAEISLTRSEGLPHVGVYVITADLLLTEWEPVETTDRINPKIPQARLTVTD